MYVCVYSLYSLGKRSGCITPLTVGTPPLEKLFKAPKFNFQMTKCFPTRGDRHQNISFLLLFGDDDTQNISLSLFERYFFLRIFSVTSHVTRTNTNSNNVFPESAPFLCSLSVLSHIYIYIYSTDDDDVNDDVNEFRRRRFCAEFSAPVSCSV